MAEIKLYKSPLKALRLMLLCLPFVVTSIYDIVTHSSIMPAFMSWFCICFFGLGVPIALFNLLDRRPQIIINANGIFDRMAYTDFINWNLIKDAYLVDVHDQQFICLQLYDSALHLIKKRKLMKLSKQMGFQEINLSLGNIKIDERRFLDFILAMSKAEHADQQNLIDSFKNYKQHEPTKNSHHHGQQIRS